MDIKEIINRIRTIRDNANFSARQLSEEIGMNSAYISRLESAKDSFEPSISVLLNIISACGITEEEFFYHSMLDYKTDKKIFDLLAKCKNEEIKKAVIKILENS